MHETATKSIPPVQGITVGPSNIYGSDATELDKSIKPAIPPNEGRTCSHLIVLFTGRSMNVYERPKNSV